MIVIDSSAIVAMLLNEPEASAIRNVIDAEDDKRISVATVLECAIVLHGKVAMPSDQLEAWLDGFLGDMRVTIEPVALEHLGTARKAYVAFGKGMGHPAQLNFGDCFSYALARSLDAPLLYKGGDFGHTDIKSAL